MSQPRKIIILNTQVTEYTANGMKINIPLENQHPERENGEFFVGNCPRSDYSTIKWEKKRMGTLAYENGHIVPGLVPIFVSAQEYLAAMANLNKECYA